MSKVKEDVFLKPKEKDLIVRDPISMTPLSNKGEYKSWYGNSGKYWRRRVRDGSAIICRPPVKEKVYAQESKSKKMEDN